MDTTKIVKEFERQFDFTVDALENLREYIYELESICGEMAEEINDLNKQVSNLEDN